VGPEKVEAGAESARFGTGRVSEEEVLRRRVVRKGIEGK
jgi:hypothetical protein